MKNTAPFLLFFVTLMVAACAGPVTMAPLGSSPEIQAEAQRQQEMLFKKYIQDQDRLFNIAHPVLTANESFCQQKSPAVGFTAWNIYTIGAKYRSAAKGVYNMQDRLAVQFVADGGPAARANIRSGDFILAVNGQNVPPGPDALKIAARLLDQAGYDTSRIVLERNGRQINTRLTPARGCDIPVLLNYGNNDINAFFDGNKIVIFKGILRLAENDNEVALVVSHELGHAVMSHIGKQQQNAMVGNIGGFVLDSVLQGAGVATGGEFAQLGAQLGAERYAVAFEQEADYVGMYFMERAGYNSSRVADFWRRMAAENPGALYTRTSHPTSPERFIAIEHTAREIAAKRSRGQSLIPNIKQK